MGSIIDDVRDGNLAGVRQALALGANVNETNSSGDTPLIMAAYKGHVEIVRLLLESGADVLACNSGGWTPLKLAEGYGGAATAALIKEHIEGPKSPWKRLDDDVLAHVVNYPAIHQSLTTLFNFKSRERFIIARNLAAAVQSMTPPTSFDVLPRPVVEEALDQFTQQGGHADRDYVFSGVSSMDKPKLKSRGI